LSELNNINETLSVGLKVADEFDYNSAVINMQSCMRRGMTLNADVVRSADNAFHARITTENVTCSATVSVRYDRPLTLPSLKADRCTSWPV